MQYIEMGCAPYEEDCAQVGSEDYPQRSRKECNAFMAQLQRMHGAPPQGARIGVKSFSHDFGMYREVVVWYNDEEGLEYALKLEGDGPARWDEEARQALRQR